MAGGSQKAKTPLMWLYSNVLKNIGVAERSAEVYNDFMRKPRELEKIVKGFSNHRRIQIMTLLDREPELSVIEVADELGINFKTASEHIRRLAQAGLVLKRNEGAAVRHVLSSLGRIILKFLRTLE